MNNTRERRGDPVTQLRKSACKGTLRRNPWDKREWQERSHLYNPEQKLSLSIDKGKRWENLGDISVCKTDRADPILEFQPPSRYISVSQYPNHYLALGPSVTYKLKSASPEQRKIAEVHRKSHALQLIVPYAKTEYPLYRQFRKRPSGPCKTCFRNDGRSWQLAGLGKKSLKKSKC